MITRTPHQVAKRTLILATLAYRGSLEATDLAGAAEMARRLPGYLEELAISDDLDPTERDELATPLGNLSGSQRIDLNWAGEASAFFAWTLDLAPRPVPAVPAPSSVAAGILKLEARHFLHTSHFVSPSEIEDVCKQIVLIRSMLQERRVEGPARDILRRFNIRKLTNVGLRATEADHSRADEVVHAMSLDEQFRAAGLYLVREHAALWLFRTGKTYFDDEPRTTSF